jgi:hypothetical protein
MRKDSITPRSTTGVDVAPSARAMLSAQPDSLPVATWTPVSPRSSAPSEGNNETERPE